ncbi:hypothetical protein [Nocardia higoensis]|uniref:hypothetical protein n=1 Tax=Nocardia higoensis TaxID=228599 RepID=UPI0005938442|nr:hypothetical protein [Nocardia higoensis]
MDLHPQELPADDLRAVDRLSSPVLAHLLRAAAGLSRESVDLLASMAERLRAAEGALPDPAGY